MAREAGFGNYVFEAKAMFERFEALVRADEREQINDEWWMCVQSDLEHGVKSLNETAAANWNKEYPEIAKFGAWLAARGNT
jgi:transposase-like protein